MHEKQCGYASWQNCESLVTECFWRAVSSDVDAKRRGRYVTKMEQCELMRVANKNE